MPAIRVVCVTFIEFWRGVPLITVLFMSSVMLPLFLPEGMNFDKLLRAMIGVILFQSAYAGWKWCAVVCRPSPRASSTVRRWAWATGAAWAW
jgi:hypothetical protein